MSNEFDNAKRGAVVKPDPNKVRITIRLDADIIEHFKRLVHESGGGNYQTLINDALRDYLKTGDPAFEKQLRKIIREELRKAS